MRPLLVHLAAVVLAALAGSAFAVGNPRLSSLQIEIWPEYDRPQTLVIIKGELAADAKLPAAVSLRIPASAGVPAAVAYTDALGNLLNLSYERQDAGPFLMLRLTTPQRSFHVEFYEPLRSNAAEREYRYEWPGDFAVDRLGVLVKEPAAASNVSVSPELGIAGASPDGVKYRAADFGALKAGERLPIAVRYTKTDPRSTSEILGSAAPAVQRETKRWPWLLAIGAALLVLAVSVALLWRQRKRRAPAAAGVACPKCGRPAAPGDRFCGGCGKALKS